MKKVILISLVSAMLAGCAPSYVRNDASVLSDSELCSRMGYSHYTSDADSLRSGYQELIRRASLKSLTLSENECKSYASMGEMEAQKDEQRKSDMVNGMNAELYRQSLQNQNRSAPVTTTCNGFGNSVSCTTF